MEQLHSKTFKLSFIFKLFGLIFALAISVMVLLAIYKNVIFSETRTHGFFVLISIVVAIFTLAFFFLHHLLKPLYELKQGVQEISKGNLTVQLSVKSKDEFGSLTNAFNKMAKNIQLMIRAREQLLFDVSHELRTPITRSKIAIEMLPDSKQKQSIFGDLKEMETMITELLETARLNNGNASPTKSEIKISSLITKTLSMFEAEKHRLKLHPIYNELLLTIDTNKIISVLKNLIENSLKYSSEYSNPIEISVIERNNKAIIRIEDFGQGIPDENLPYIFEPFYRVDKSRSKKTGGYGLGLHLSKKIMDAHSGEINIYNKTESSGLIAEVIFA